MNRFLLLVLALAASIVTWADDEPEFSQTASTTTTIEIRVESKSRMCEALASLDYLQRGAEAEVVTNIHTEDCAAAGGNYTLNITVRGDSDTEPRTLNFEESWERNDDAPVETLRLYPIGDDVDLLRIKARKLSCMCADTSDQQGD